MTIHKGYGVAIRPTGAGAATLIGGVETQEFTSNSTHLTQITSGQGSPQSVSVSAVKPRMTFSSYQVGRLLDLLGVKGACLSGGAAPGFEMYELNTDACGAITAAATHRKIIAPNGRVVPRTLSCNHEADAQLACEVVPIFDGTNLPVIVSAGVAAPTGLADTERFTLGPVTLMDLPIKFVQSISIDFGNQVETVGGDGDIYPKNVDIQNFGPTITITCLDVGQFAAAKLKLDGVALAQDDTSLVLRRRVNATGSFSEDADSIELTAAGVASVQSVSASGNQPKTMQILITCIHDGTNEPIVAATDHDLTPA